MIPFQVQPHFDVKVDATAENYIQTVWNLPAMQEWIQAAQLESLGNL